tara:strand:- start:331 stop:690 length:360 start_codon:yes stop_codon:yes gene_type:complete
MQLDKKNFEKYAFDNYRNAIADKAEFKEDLRKAQHARKLATKIVNGKDVNIRLLVNHVILFFNVFEATAAKELLLYHSNDAEKRVFKTIFEYLSYLNTDEYPEIKFCLETAVLLKKLRN